MARTFDGSAGTRDESQELYRELAVADKYKPLTRLHAHFWGNWVTREVTARFFAIPPSTTGPI
jgi:hypothetical protein